MFLIVNLFEVTNLTLKRVPKLYNFVKNFKNYCFILLLFSVLNFKMYFLILALDLGFKEVISMCLLFCITVDIKGNAA